MIEAASRGSGAVNEIAVRLNARNSRIKPKNILDPFRRAKHSMVLPIRALETKGEAFLLNPAGSDAAGAPSQVHGARIPGRR
jgi:hypothetical protein